MTAEVSSADPVRVDPASAEYLWVARIIGAVELRAGRRSLWNGTIYEQSDERFIGAVGPDGSMMLSRTEVLGPLCLADADRRLTAQEEVLLLEAVATVTHEALHLCQRDGDPTAPGAHPVFDAPSTVLDEGLTESWTHRNLDDVVYDVDLDTAAPGLTRHRSLDSYPVYTAVTDALLSGLEIALGRPYDELAEEIRTTDVAQRWTAVADLVIDHRLSGLVPDDDRWLVRQSLANRLRDAVAGAQRIQESRSEDRSKTSAGRRLGQKAVSDLMTQLDRLVERYREPAGAADAQLDQPCTLVDGLTTVPQAVAPRRARALPRSRGRYRIGRGLRDGRC